MKRRRIRVKRNAQKVNLPSNRSKLINIPGEHIYHERWHRVYGNYEGQWRSRIVRLSHRDKDEARRMYEECISRWKTYTICTAICMSYTVSIVAHTPDGKPIKEYFYACRWYTTDADRFFDWQADGKPRKKIGF